MSRAAKLIATAIASAATATVTAATAQAATPFDRAPPLDAPIAPGVAGLDQIGIRAGMPTFARTPPPYRRIAAGTAISLRVTQRRPLTITLTRITATGRPMRTIARGSARTFTTAMPTVPGARYRLMLGTTGGIYLYVPRGANATLHLDRPHALRGETLGAVLRNTGDIGLTTGDAYTLERQTPNGWVPAPAFPPDTVPNAAPYPVAINTERRVLILLSPNLIPGRHRVTWSAATDRTDVREPVQVAAEFDVG